MSSVPGAAPYLLVTQLEDRELLSRLLEATCRELPEPPRVWEEALAADTATRRTLYIHIPYCRSRCPFCPFYFGGAGVCPAPAART